MFNHPWAFRRTIAANITLACRVLTPHLQPLHLPSLACVPAARHLENAAPRVLDRSSAIAIVKAINPIRSAVIHRDETTGAVVNPPTTIKVDVIRRAGISNAPAITSHPVRIGAGLRAVVLTATVAASGTEKNLRHVRETGAPRHETSHTIVATPDRPLTSETEIETAGQFPTPGPQADP